MQWAPEFWKATSRCLNLDIPSPRSWFFPWTEAFDWLLYDWIHAGQESVIPLLSLYINLSGSIFGTIDSYWSCCLWVLVLIIKEEYEFNFTEQISMILFKLCHLGVIKHLYLILGTNIFKTIMLSVMPILYQQSKWFSFEFCYRSFDENHIDISDVNKIMK